LRDMKVQDIGINMCAMRTKVSLEIMIKTDIETVKHKLAYVLLTVLLCRATVQRILGFSFESTLFQVSSLSVETKHIQRAAEKITPGIFCRFLTKVYEF